MLWVKGDFVLKTNKYSLLGISFCLETISENDFVDFWIWESKAKIVEKRDCECNTELKNLYTQNAQWSSQNQ